MYKLGQLVQSSVVTEQTYNITRDVLADERHIGHSGQIEVFEKRLLVGIQNLSNLQGK